MPSTHLLDGVAILIVLGALLLTLYALYRMSPLAVHGTGSRPLPAHEPDAPYQLD